MNPLWLPMPATFYMELHLRDGIIYAQPWPGSKYIVAIMHWHVYVMSSGKIFGEKSVRYSTTPLHVVVSPSNMAHMAMCLLYHMQCHE